MQCEDKQEVVCDKNKKTILFYLKMSIKIKIKLTIITHKKVSKWLNKPNLNHD